MAKFLEYQGKDWLRKGGLLVPDGRAASTPEEARKIAEELGKSVAIKGPVQAIRDLCGWRLGSGRSTFFP